jgi:hypothetical protein
MLYRCSAQSLNAEQFVRIPKINIYSLKEYYLMGQIGR